MKEIMKSRGFKIASIVVGIILFALVNFAIGIKVGSHRALFSCDWGKNYEKNFMGPRPPFGHPGFFEPMMRDFSGRDFRNAHGLAGTIISIAENKLIIKDRDGKENTVAVNDKTIIKSGRDDIEITDFKNNQQIVVLGKPGDDGVISADLIRVFNGEKK